MKDKNTNLNAGTNSDTSHANHALNDTIALVYRRAAVRSAHSAVVFELSEETDEARRMDLAFARDALERVSGSLLSEIQDKRTQILGLGK